MHKATDFSVLMAVYYGDRPDYLNQAISSILDQSLVPKEIVIVKDGILPFELENLLNNYKDKFPLLFNFIQIPKNSGLGTALSIGLKKCKYDIIARMDSDDICESNRFSIQINYFLKFNLDILGCSIEEFNKEPGDLKIFRTPPLDKASILKYSKFRNPFNHPTVIFNKQKILQIGNYSSEFLLFEDWHLWVRAIKNNLNTENLDLSLLNFRVGNKFEVIKRRSGIKYLKYELNFINYLLKNNYFNFYEYVIYIFLKLPIRLLPIKFIVFIYYNFLRN